MIAFDLPHLRGRGEVLHLMSLVSPLADDLVVAFMPLLPVRLVELFEERGIEIVEVPDGRVREHGRERARARAARRRSGSRATSETRRRLERAGVTMHVYEGTELSKGDGGPTCLTRPLLRD